ncbi:MAG TPA: GGDEF domain-containing protein [Gaiellaceae bacterium]|nr:GGDEF domain-containing protein [Gaiellaceae bacterium]
MTAAATLNRRIVLPLALLLYGGVFSLFILVETPGLGLGHFFYVPICLVALVSDELMGVLAGCVAAGLYAVAVVVDPRVPSALALTDATLIRMVTFATVGGLIGFYASRNRRLVERLREHAGRDFITGLWNARMFDEELAKRCSGGSPFALVLADVDDLKAINDVHGHAAGNAALKRVGEVLVQHADAHDVVARIGGDQFAVLTELAPNELTALTTRVNRTLSTESVALTFGTTRRPDDGETAAELFHKADDRLFAAKLVRANRATVVALADAR